MDPQHGKEIDDTDWAVTEIPSIADPNVRKPLQVWLPDLAALVGKQNTQLGALTDAVAAVSKQIEGVANMLVALAQHIDNTIPGTATPTDAETRLVAASEATATALTHIAEKYAGTTTPAAAPTTPPMDSQP